MESRAVQSQYQGRNGGKNYFGKTDKKQTHLDQKINTDIYGQIMLEVVYACLGCDLILNTCDVMSVYAAKLEKRHYIETIQGPTITGAEIQ